MPNVLDQLDKYMTRQDRSVLIMLVLTLFGVLIFWRDGVTDLIRIWTVSPTYGHGFLVLPVSLVLIALGWRKGESFRSWPPALFALLPLSILYWFGLSRDIHILQHTAIVFSVVSLTLGHLGTRFATRHRFALAFLVFLIPVGEELIPLLQAITAQGIMVMTAIFDVVAIRDGTMIRTDAGDFIVERGCAGLRYQIAAIMVGTLGAHLFFATPWKQGAYFLTSLIIPILANIIRASSVVIIATWTDMQHLTGFSHVVYGWGLFSIVMVAIILLGLLLAERDAPRRPEPEFAPFRKLPTWVMAGSLGLIAIAGIT